VAGSDREIVGVAEGTFATESKHTNLGVGVGLGAGEIYRIDIVYVLMRNACAKVLNRDPRFQSIWNVDMERTIGLTRCDMGIHSIATKFTNDGERFVRVERRKNLKCFLTAPHLELRFIGDVADSFDSGFFVLNNHWFGLLVGLVVR